MSDENSVHLLLIEVLRHFLGIPASVKQAFLIQEVNVYIIHLHGCQAFFHFFLCLRGFVQTEGRFTEGFPSRRHKADFHPVFIPVFIPDSHICTSAFLF